MEKRPLGRTGMDVSVICLGTMTWGQQNTEAEGHEQMDYALDQGINFFDTAELYSIPPKAETQGSTERIIGSWFKERGNRDKVILASKVVGATSNKWFRGQEEGVALPTKQNVFEAVDASLKRLQTDYIDLYQLHWPGRPFSIFGTNPIVWEPTDGPEVAVAETLDAFDELVKSGKVRAIGLSNESSWGAMRWITAVRKSGKARIASIQNAYNIVNRTYEVNLAEVGMREDVGLLAYSPLGQGYLTGKYRNGAKPAGARGTLFGRLGPLSDEGGAERPWKPISIFAMRGASTIRRPPSALRRRNRSSPHRSSARRRWTSSNTTSPPGRCRGMTISTRRSTRCTCSAPTSVLSRTKSRTRTRSGTLTRQSARGPGSRPGLDGRCQCLLSVTNGHFSRHIGSGHRAAHPAGAQGAQMVDVRPCRPLRHFQSGDFQDRTRRNEPNGLACWCGSPTPST
jgi:aryl-alcohol dehydrogenase-like predicted oxidoreductase